MREIERILRRVGSAPHSTYDEAKVEIHKLEIQRILDILIATITPVSDSDNVVESTLYEAQDRFGGITTTPFPASNAPAVGRLIERAFALSERPSLIESVVSSKDESDAIHDLKEEDAQSFIDVIDEVHSTTARPVQITEIDVSAWIFHQSGASGHDQPFTVCPKEMPQTAVQHLW